MIARSWTLISLGSNIISLVLFKIKNQVWAVPPDFKGGHLPMIYWPNIAVSSENLMILITALWTIVTPY